MGQNDLLKGLRDITGESQVKVDEPMSIHTTFRIGGTADYFVMPSSISELQSVLHLLKKSDIVPESITGGLGTVAIRMPSHKVAAELIRSSGVYIAAPSANTSGKPSPTLASHVIKDLSGKIDMIIADDTVDIGVESTIIDLSEDVPTILRPGFITKEMFEEVVGEVRIDPAITDGVKAGVVPKAPGMKYKHYAPDADLKIIEDG